MTDFLVQVQATVSLKADDQDRFSVLTQIAGQVMDRIANTSQGFGITECHQVSVASGHFTATVLASGVEDDVAAVELSARQLRDGLAAVADPRRTSDGLLSFKVDPAAFSAELPYRMAM